MLAATASTRVREPRAACAEHRLRACGWPFMQAYHPPTPSHSGPEAPSYPAGRLHHKAYGATYMVPFVCHMMHAVCTC